MSQFGARVQITGAVNQLIYQGSLQSSIYCLESNVLKLAQDIALGDKLGLNSSRELAYVVPI
jgi:hypothetical protein